MQTEPWTLEDQAVLCFRVSTRAASSYVIADRADAVIMSRAQYYDWCGHLAPEDIQIRGSLLMNR